MSAESRRLFIGTRADGFTSGFCDACKANGWEPSRYTQWERIKRSAR
jgi:hypothetical protein